LIVGEASDGDPDRRRQRRGIPAEVRSALREKVPVLIVILGWVMERIDLRLAATTADLAKDVEFSEVVVDEWPTHRCAGQPSRQLSTADIQRSGNIPAIAASVPSRSPS